MKNLITYTLKVEGTARGVLFCRKEARIQLHISVGLPLGRTPISEQMPLFSVGDSLLRSSASQPRARHGGSRGLGMGAKLHPAPEREGAPWNSPGRCCPKLHELQEPSLCGPVRGNHQDLFLVLPWEMHICSCVPASCGEQNFGQGIPRWAMGGFLVSKNTTCASPNQLQISWTTSGWFLHSPWNVCSRESSSAAQLSSL